MTRIAAIQMNSGDSVPSNLAAADRLLRAASAAGAVLAALPENFAFMGARDADKLAHAETPGAGPVQDFLAEAAQRLKLWLVAGTVPLTVPGRNDRVFAASLLFGADGGCAARYDKIHLFDVAVPGGERYRESAYIEPGAQRFVVSDTPAGRIGLSVCYDLRFPELYRGLVQAGAEILAVPSAFTRRTGEAHWHLLLRARAVENQCYVLAPGQCGSHPGGRSTFGHSLVADPWGEVLAERADGEGVVLAEVKRDRLRELRETFPALKHRRL